MGRVQIGALMIVGVELLKKEKADVVGIFTARFMKIWV